MKMEFGGLLTLGDFYLIRMFFLLIVNLLPIMAMKISLKFTKIYLKKLILTKSSASIVKICISVKFWTASWL